MLEMPIIELDSIDSTNNYAMQLIDADKAQHGLTITARSQTGGKGQRGKSWIDKPGESLLMSLITTPKLLISEQFLFNASVAVAIANILQKLNTTWKIKIKWPNDIIINDKKAGGILIENVLRGSRWVYSVIGIGLNIKQVDFPVELPFATSLKIGSGIDFEIAEIRDFLIENILFTIAASDLKENMKKYNEYLYKSGGQQLFSDNNSKWEATILNANNDGTISVQMEDGTIVSYYHGQVLWEWR